MQIKHLIYLINVSLLAILFSCNEKTTSSEVNKQEGVRDSLLYDTTQIKQYSTFEKNAIQAIEISYLGFRGKLVKKMRDKGIPQSMHQCTIEEVTSMNSFIQKHQFEVNRITDTSHHAFQFFKNNNQPGLMEVKENDSLFYKPIRLREGLCLSCHGKPYLDINAESFNRIKKDFQNTPYSYKMNDIMGVWEIKK